MSSSGSEARTRLTDPVRPADGLGLLLSRHCESAPAESSAVIRLSALGDLTVLAAWPEGPPAAAVPAWASEALSSASAGVRQNRSVLIGDGRDTSPVLLIALGRMPDDGRVWACYRLRTDDANPRQTSERLSLMAMGLHAADARQEIERQSQEIERLRRSVSTLMHIGEHDRFQAAAMAMCNHIASEWSCDRVSLGVVSGRVIRMAAISHTEKIVRKSTIVRDLESVMEESLDQDAEVSFPVDRDATMLAREATQFASRYGPLAIVSLPLRREGKPWGVLAVERPADQPFSLPDIAALRLVADAATSQVWIAHRHRRWFGATFLQAAREAGSWAVGPRHTWAKLTAIVVVIASVFFALVPGVYRVQGSGRVEAEVRRVVAAPFDGFIRDTQARVGDNVSAQQELARLDATDLLLRLSGLRAELDGAQREAALAQRERKDAEAQIARARARRAEAEIEFVEHQIQRAVLASPVDGVIVAGELERVVGAPVSVGDTLFEIAPLESLLLDVFIEEDQVADVAVGSVGTFATASRPDARIAVRIERIDPVAELREGRNVFRARAALQERPEWLRPGMEGIAKFDAGDRPYPWIWTRRIVNWIRMKLWI